MTLSEFVGSLWQDLTQLSEFFKCLESEIQPETDAEIDAEFTRRDTPVRGILKNGYKHDESNENTAAENTFMVEAHQWGTSWQSPTPQFGPGSAELPADLPYE